MQTFREIKGNFGFGCMRLPLLEDKTVDQKVFQEMVDMFIGAGFNYFDTAHGYLDGESEKAIKTGLTSRYPRSAYLLTDKLSHPYFSKQEDIRPLFEKQLELCGVEYFDFYLMHSQGRSNYEQYQRCRAYETAFELKKEGRIRHVGLSFHDTADFLEKILTDHPDVEIVQIQLNYIDWDDPAVQSARLLEVCRRHNKPVIVMEPVKGGNLVNLPQKARDIVTALDRGSAAALALRFAASCDPVVMTLSGMGSIQMMEDNISAMKNFRPLDGAERQAVKDIVAVLKSQGLIGCTQCSYCTAGCPGKINIPEIFSLCNTKKMFNDWNAGFYYNTVITKDTGKASDCIRCGKCEQICPQHLPIRDLLVEAAKQFERGGGED